MISGSIIFHVGEQRLAQAAVIMKLAFRAADKYSKYGHREWGELHFGPD